MKKQYKPRNQHLINHNKGLGTRPGMKTPEQALWCFVLSLLGTVILLVLLFTYEGK